MPTRQRKTKFRKAYERQQVKLQKALRRYRIGPSVPDEPATPWFPAFQYKFPADFPRAEQEAVEAALKKANQSFSNQRLGAGSNDEYKAAYDNWFREIVEAYAHAVRRTAGSLPSEHWSPMGRVDELQRYAKAAASLVHLAGGFDSEWWTSLLAAVRAPVTKAPKCEGSAPGNGAPAAARAPEKEAKPVPTRSHAGTIPAWAHELKRIRNSKELSRKALAERLQRIDRDARVSVETIKKHEEGHRPGTRTQKAYAEFYGKSVSVLFPD